MEADAASAMTLAEELKRDVAKLRSLQVSRFEDRAAILALVERRCDALQAQIDQQHKRLEAMLQQSDLVEQVHAQQQMIEALSDRLEQHGRWINAANATYDSRPVRLLRRALRVMGGRAPAS